MGLTIEAGIWTFPQKKNRIDQSRLRERSRHSSFCERTPALRLRAASARPRLEFHRDAVHAIALAGRLRPVVEDMAEGAAAPAAMHFGPRQDQAVIVRRADRVFDRRVEARPSGAALELGLRPEHRQVAAGASEDAGA